MWNNFDCILTIEPIAMKYGKRIESCQSSVPIKANCT